MRLHEEKGPALEKAGENLLYVDGKASAMVVRREQGATGKR